MAPERIRFHPWHAPPGRGCRRSQRQPACGRSDPSAAPHPGPVPGGPPLRLPGQHHQRNPPPVPRRCDWHGSVDWPGRSGSGIGSEPHRHNQKPPRHGWPGAVRSESGSPGATGRRLFHHAPFHHPGLLQQTRQSWMQLGWVIQRRHERLPPLGIQLEAPPVSRCFGRAGQGALQHEVGDAALGRSRRPEGSAWPLAAAAGPASRCARGMTSSPDLFQPPWSLLPGNVMTTPAGLILSTQNLHLQLQRQLSPGPITGHHLHAKP